MRKIISKEDAEDLIREIDGLETEWIDDNKEREIKFKEICSKFSCSEFLRLIKTILARKKYVLLKVRNYPLWMIDI